MAIEDVSTPLEGELCECTTDGPDGFYDLTLKFDAQEIIAALEEVYDGDEVVLTLMGELIDGTLIEGSDCVIIRAKGGGWDKPVASVPSSFILSQNCPNPFNPSTEITYGLPERSHVQLTIYNLLGQEVAKLVDREQLAGFHAIVWDASGLAGGLYFYRLQAGDFVETKRMVLLT